MGKPSEYQSQSERNVEEKEKTPIEFECLDQELKTVEVAQEEGTYETDFKTKIKAGDENAAEPATEANIGDLKKIRASEVPKKIKARTYNCDKCDSEFTNANDKYNHMKTSGHMERMASTECTVEGCKLTFSSYTERKKHIKEVHGQKCHSVSENTPRTSSSSVNSTGLKRKSNEADTDSSSSAGKKMKILVGQRFPVQTPDKSESPVMDVTEPKKQKYFYSCKECDPPMLFDFEGVRDHVLKHPDHPLLLLVKIESKVHEDMKLRDESKVKLLDVAYVKELRGLTLGREVREQIVDAADKLLLQDRYLECKKSCNFKSQDPVKMLLHIKKEHLHEGLSLK